VLNCSQPNQGHTVDIFANTIGLSILYLVLLGIGIIFAALVLIGGLDGIDLPGLPDFHIGVEGADGGAGSLSPVAIASFVTAFGAFGLLSLGLFNATQPWSLAWAIGGGIIVAALAHFAFSYFLIRPQGSSEVRTQDIVGAVAEVTAPIPADSVGSVTFVAQGGRVSYPAKSADGVAIARGVTVVVEKATGGVLVVRPQS
jgi:membrane protein implicated in regulation of membrane protease activity